MQNTTIEVTFCPLFTNFAWECIKILMDLDFSYENGGMHFILYVTHMSGNI